MEDEFVAIFCGTPLLQKEPIKKAAFITLGTRDVQLDRHKLEASGGLLQRHNGKLFVNINNLSIEVREAGPRQDQPAQEGRLAIVAPREGGRLILEHWDTLREALCLPLTENFLKKMKEERGHWTILFVYTDQSEDSPHHFNDTLYFKELAKLYVQEKFSNVKNFSEIAIRENPADIDFQYDSFYKKFKENTFKEIIKESEELWLLPQGGLDQVNQALTLQLILHARNKLRLFQQPENQDLKEIRFAETFLSSINRQIILEKAERFDFKGILEFKNDIPKSLNWLITITELALHILEGKFYDTAPSRKKILNILRANLKLHDDTPEYQLVEKFLTWNSKQREHRPQDTLTLHSWYYLLRVAQHNREWEDVLAFLFRISEHAVAHWIQEHYTDRDRHPLNFQKLCNAQLANNPAAENPELLNVINEISRPGTVQTLRDQNIYLNNPNYLLFAKLFEYLREDLFHGYTEELRRSVQAMNAMLSPQNQGKTLRGLRNRMEHSLRRISEEEFFDAFNTKESLNHLLSTLETLCGAHGFMFFERLKHAYHDHLGPA